MKPLVFNSTPLIYLTKAGLSRIIEGLQVEKLTSPLVKREVVDEGKRKGVPDAIVLDKLFADSVFKVCQPSDRKFLAKLTETRGLHLADAEVLALAREREGIAVIDDEVFGYQHINVAQQQADPGSLWYTIRHMLLIRKQYRAFGRGTFEFILPDNDGVLGYWRVYCDETGQELERFLIIVNLTDGPQPVPLDLSARAGVCPVDALSGEAWAEIQAVPYTFELGPYAYYWLRL